MQIGEAARRSGLEASAIRFYEQERIVPSPARTPTGYRDYADHDVELLQFVRRLRSLELPLDDIRQVVELRTGGDAPCGVVRSAIARESDAIDRRIRELTQLRTELRELQAAAEVIEDAWPSSCVCHLIQA